MFKHTYIVPKSIKFFKKILIFIAVAVIVTAFSIPINRYSASTPPLTIFAKDKKYTFYSYEIARYNGKYHLKNVNEIVDGIYLDTVIRPKNASVSFTPSKSVKFNYSSEKLGEELLKNELIEEIEKALNNNQKTVTAKFIKTKPTVTVNDLKKENVLRAKFTTCYASSIASRKHNIKLASSKINGFILNEGEEFSFNKTVGVRSEENGYLPAKIILQGEYVDGVGGGVCQVSTTLYNVALLCGLKITEQHPHSLQVGYVEPSFDAMVNSYTSDLKFLNNTGGKLYISLIADNEKITASIYGLKQKESFERVSKIIKTCEYNEYLYEDDESLSIGSLLTVRYPKGSVESEGYLIKYLNGERVLSYKIRKDSYREIKGLIKVGKGLTNDKK